MLLENPTLTTYKGPKFEFKYLSASSLGSYLTCGMKYRLSYIEKLELDSKISVHLKFGEAFHGSLEPYWKGGKTNFDAAWRKYERTPIEYYGGSWEEYYAKGLRMVSAAANETQGKFNPASSVVERTENIDLGFAMLNRRTDLITELINMPVIMDGVLTKISGLSLLDLKTSGQKYGLDSALESQQLMTYAIPNPKLDTRPKFYMYFVVTKSAKPVVQLIGHTYTRDEIKGQIRRYRQATDMIHQGVFIQNKGCSACARFCDFRQLCYPDAANTWQKVYKKRADYKGK